MITNVRLVKTKHGRLDGGRYHKPEWAIKFERDGINCSSRVINNGKDKPLGQDIIDTMQGYIDSGQITKDELLDMRIID